MDLKRKKRRRKSFDILTTRCRCFGIFYVLIALHQTNMQIVLIYKLKGHNTIYIYTYTMECCVTTYKHVQICSMGKEEDRTLYKFNAHEQLHALITDALVVMKCYCSDSWSQLRNRQASLPGKVVLLGHIIFMHFNPKHRQFRDR